MQSEELAAGDHVKVELDPDVWKRMQQGHGEWNDRMAEVIIVHIDIAHSNTTLHKINGNNFHRK